MNIENRQIIFDTIEKIINNNERFVSEILIRNIFNFEILKEFKYDIDFLHEAKRKEDLKVLDKEFEKVMSSDEFKALNNL